MSGKSEKGQKSLAEVLAEVFGKLKDCYTQVDNEKFRKLLVKLDADGIVILSALRLVTYFDSKSKKFRIPYQRMITILADNTSRLKEFDKVIKNYKPGEKGKKGGFKRFHKEFRQDRDERSDILINFKMLKEQRYKTVEEKERLKNYTKNIPPNIKAKIRSTNSKILALEWMLPEYPLTRSALIQIVCYKEK